jgi:uncharacterized protein YbjQ (UPF0145 family)
MKKQLALLALMTALAAFALAARAEDRILHFPLKDVIDMPEAKGKLDGSVKFYLAGQADAPKPVQKIGEDVSNRRTNALNKDDAFACKWAALSALIAFQNTAKSHGADAVVDIESYFKKETYSDPVNFECRKGALMAAVTLKGMYVKTK